MNDQMYAHNNHVYIRTLRFLSKKTNSDKIPKKKSYIMSEHMCKRLFLYFKSRNYKNNKKKITAVPHVFSQTVLIFII